MKTITQNFIKIVLLITIHLSLFTQKTQAQAPEKFSYQAVVRNASNALVANANVGIRISIWTTCSNCVIAYQETHTTTTNINGLFSIEIGSGIPWSLGSFSNVNWSSDTKYISTEIDPTGGTNYTITSTTQLLSVPFALHAKTAESTTDNKWTANGNNIGNNNTGNVGIGTTTPTEKLDVVGKTKTTNLQVTTGAGVGKVLTSDATGNATWQTAGNFNSTVNVLTNEAITVSQGTATMGGTILSDGGSPITERGIVWSKTNTTPTTADTKIIRGTGKGTFTASLSDASFLFTFYIRAYAINANGTFYGDVVTFNPSAQVSTFATTGSDNFSQNLVIDSNGNLYYASRGTHQILKYTPNGTMTVFAGSGTAGFTNGVGTSATFNEPASLAIDAAQNIYVGEEGNNVIRKITPSGIVTTVAGDGTAGYVDGLAANARFNYPRAIALDASGNIFVADRFNHLIRKITPSGFVSTLAGSTAGLQDGTGFGAKFERPSAIAVASNGEIWVGDFFNCCIRKVTQTGVVTTPFYFGCGGSVDGTGPTASFDSVGGLTFDAQGNLLIAEFFGSKIRKATPALVVTSLTGSTGVWGYQDGDANQALLYQPTGIAVDNSNGKIYFTDRNAKIRVLQ
ncbi:MAG: hypothetical protein JNJ52_13885 [Flavobacterium sp.]|nr:hypothetical protein [Flavobacterium sp.]